MSVKKYTVKQLQTELKKAGIKYNSKHRKHELINLLGVKKNNTINEFKQHVNIGIHVSKKKDMVESIINTRRILGVNAIQIFTHGPRNLTRCKMEYDEVIHACKGINLYVHSAYITNPWADTSETMQATVEQFATSHILKSRGVVLHIPKLNPQSVVEPIPKLVALLKARKLMKGQKIILEMKAVKQNPIMSYESPEKINRLIRLLKYAGLNSNEVGLCIDTAHIYAGKAQIFTYQEGVDYCNAIEYPEWICLLHLNGNEYDAKKRAGDKHAVPMDGPDKIWNTLTYRESGCKAFIQYAHRLKIDIILEVKDHHTTGQIKAFLHSACADL